MSFDGRSALGRGTALVCAALVLGLVPALAGAGQRSVSVSTDLDTVDETGANPRRGLASLGVGVQLPVTKSVSAALGLAYVRDRRSAATAGVPYEGTSGSVTALQAGLSWQRSDRLSMLFSGSWAPSASATYGVPLSDVATGSTVTSALVSSKTATSSLQTTLSLDTAGDGPLDHQLDVSVGWVRIDSLQQLLELANAAGAATSAPLTCTPPGKSHNTKQCERVAALAPASASPSTPGAPQAVVVDTLALGGTYTLTISDKTALAVGATRYSYPGTDPSAIGFFSLTTAARTTILTAGHGRKATQTSITVPGTVLQGGIPLAPLSWEMEAEASHDFGLLSFGLSGGFGRYHGQEGGDRWAGARLSYGSGKAWQVTVGAELGWSDDADGIGVGIGRVQLAVGHRF